jgi:hypothetical protein
MFKKTLIITFVLTVLGIAFWYANTAKAQEFVTDGLISFWNFDKSNVAGKTIKDVWGKSDGTIIGGDPQLVAGKVEDALKLDGTIYVEMPMDSPVDKALTGKPNFTVEFWANVASDVAHQAWFAKGEGAQSKAIRILADPGGNEWGMHFWDNDWWTGVATGGWQHIVYTFDGTSNVGQIFKDGKLQGDHTFATVNFTSSVVWIAKEIWSGSSLGKGMIDEVRVYSKVLTQNEVEQNFLVDSASSVQPVGKLSTTWGDIKIVTE